MDTGKKSLKITPCAGRCSTTFGDRICRGCRRFDHEIIAWNTYNLEQRYAIWIRLDAQLDQILIPMLPHADLASVESFLIRKKIKFLPEATQGRKLYLALRFCEKHPSVLAESGLGLQHIQYVKQIWQNFEKKVLFLATASYDIAWNRAEKIKKNLIDICNT